MSFWKAFKSLFTSVKNIQINCQQASFLHEKQQQGELTEAEQRSLWLHNQYCSLCRVFAQQIEKLERAVGICSKSVSGEKRLDSGIKTAMQRTFNELTRS